MPDPSGQPAAPARPWGRALRWLKVHTGHVVMLSVLVGVVAGLGAVLFAFLLDEVNTYALVRGAQYTMPQPGAEGGTGIVRLPGRRWVLILAPALGGLLAGVLIYSLAPEAEGHGTDAVIDAFHRRRGQIRARVPLVKTIASVLTIGTGGSAGREGPIGQIGAGFASALCRLLHSSDRNRRLLVIAGAGAGIGAIFRAPLGGALFACEVLYREAEFESAALVPAFVASIVAYSVYCGITGVWGPIFDVRPFHFLHPGQLPFFLLLGIACVPVGWLYVRVFYGIRNGFRRIAIPNHLKPFIGGLAVGAIGFVMPQVLGMGYGWAQIALDGQMTVALALAILFLKIVATGLTIGSGGSGGVFAPSMVIGGMLGAALGALFHHVAPGTVDKPAAFMLVGMAGFFAGVAKVPVASLVMVSEMTSGYGLLVPLMLTNAIAFLFTPRSISIYERQVNTRADSGAHAGEFFYDVLERIPVSEVVALDGRFTTFARGTPIRELLAAVAESAQPVFPVLNADGSVFGLIDPNDVRVLFKSPSIPPGLLIAADLCLEDFHMVMADESLATALRKLRNTTLDALPVADESNPKIARGLISRRDIGNAYHDHLYQTSAEATITPAAASQGRS